MKVVFLATDPLEGTGYARISYHLSYYLADHGVEVVHVAIDYNLHPQNVTKRTRHPKIRYIDSRVGNSKDVYGPPMIKDVLVKEKPDIFLVYNDVIVIFRVLNEIEKIVNRSFKTIAYLDVIYDGTRPDLLQQIARRLDKVYVFSDHWLQEIPKGPEARVLHHWVDEKFKIIDKYLCRKVFNIGEDDYVVVNANRNSSHKQTDVTIRAFLMLYKRLSESDRKKIKLFLVCRIMSDIGYNLIELLRAECNLMGLGDQFEKILKGSIIHQSEVSDEAINIIFNAGDIGITSSSIEGFGLCPLEMGSLNKPQVVSGVGGLLDVPYTETVTPFTRIYCSDSESFSQRGYKSYSKAEDFSDVLLKYYLNRDLIKSEGDKLGNHIREKYDKQKILDKWFIDFKETLNN